MAKAAATCVVAMALALAVLMALASGATAAQCNAGQLIVCAPAIIGGAAPTAACCSNLRAQQGCFCEFARNPAYASYIKSQTARKAIAACRVALPRCP
ncbi:non-specific lipid-transfer protein 2 [Brachypodium distachyon]|uniref:Bifunctional inhibitor/plant lipid transfer protein/seed storage helical domain-containing protein n=1 Tax=Brachypodium distachyon TaxID=15368 RepID=I1I580_BRADI|nr:non-specific lipid-transfer protein 2 [Brachypodium distachyon]KQJ97366.1 hypothetical protein BRADI_3g30300v3 [Brachypodium distachyon]|eukprot:XP_014755771.1 non-specific lipid-transfer protein 2 [Brachypodium distachyon]